MLAKGSSAVTVHNSGFERQKRKETLAAQGFPEGEGSMTGPSKGPAAYRTSHMTTNTRKRIGTRVVPVQKSSKLGIDFDHLADLLKVPQAHDPNAHTAGGYLRDHILGRVPKDIDVFVHHGAFKAIQ